MSLGVRVSGRMVGDETAGGTINIRVVLWSAGCLLSKKKLQLAAVFEVQLDAVSVNHESRIVLKLFYIL